MPTDAAGECSIHLPTTLTLSAESAAAAFPCCPPHSLLSDSSDVTLTTSRDACSLTHGNAQQSRPVATRVTPTPPWHTPSRPAPSNSNTHRWVEVVPLPLSRCLFHVANPTPRPSPIRLVSRRLEALPAGKAVGLPAADMPFAHTHTRRLRLACPHVGHLACRRCPHVD